jgi:hypothetical protein
MPLLPVNRQLSWDVLASNTCGSGPLSLPLYFVINASECAPTQAPLPQGPRWAAPEARPLFNWSPLANATCYSLDVYQQSNGGRVLHEENITGTMFMPLAELPAGVPYRWVVRAKNACGPGPDSEAADFSIRDDCPPVYSPVATDGPWGLVQEKTPTFSWRPMAGAPSYILSVRDLDTNTIPLQVTTKATTFTAKDPLPAGHTLIWDLGASNSCGSGPLSPWIVFTINESNCAPRQAPILNGPAGTVDDATPTFSWSAVPGATSYSLYVQTDVGGTLSQDSITSLSFTPTQGLLEGVPLRWSVRANNSCGPGPYSKKTSFMVDSTPCPR